MDEREKEKLKKDIDILFGDDENAAIATLIEYLPEKKSIEELTEEDFINLYAEIMSKIESDDEVYEYFTSKKETNIIIYIDLIKYTKKHIEDIHKAIEERTKLDLKNDQIVELIKSLGPIEIEKYLTPEKVKEFELYSYQITELIKATGNVKEYLLPGQRKDNPNLELNMANLIYKKCSNEEISVEEYLTPEKVREFELDSFDITELIKATEKIEEYLTPEKVRQLRLYSHEITDLIKANGKIKKYLLPGQKIIDKNLEFNMANLIYKKCCDENISVEEYLTPEKVRQLWLNSDEITDLIKATEKIEEYLTLEKVKEFELYSYQITELIKATGKIEEYLTLEKVRDFGLDLENITELIEATGRDVEEFLQDMIKPYLSVTSIEEKINLPSSMTIGMEIESLGENNNLLKCVINGLTKWSSKGDVSLCPDIPSEEGIEVVSPILTGDNEKTTGEILKICNILNALGNHTNQTCGGHIHIGADYLTNIDAWKNLLDLWANLEETLYTIGNEEGQIPREGTLRFAGPVSKEYKDAMDDGSISLKDENDIANFKKQIIKAQQTRYRGMNFQNLAEGGKNTIEFRLPNGTVNAETWIQNINLFGGLVRTAEELSKIQGKDESDLSEEEKKKLELFESIKNEDLSEEEKFEALLELVIEEQSRDVYRKRYGTNHKLIEENPSMQTAIRSKISKPSNISKNKIGKEILTGEERITGSEELVAERIIDQELEIENIKGEG